MTRHSTSSPSPSTAPAPAHAPATEHEEHEEDQDGSLDSDYDVDASGADHQGPWKSETVPQPQKGFRSKFKPVDAPSPTKYNSKYRPNVAGEGDNLPLEILRCLSEWCSVLESRGSVPGLCFVLYSSLGFELG